jgi:hypothetical protein
MGKRLRLASPTWACTSLMRVDDSVVFFSGRLFFGVIAGVIACVSGINHFVKRLTPGAHSASRDAEGPAGAYACDVYLWF